MVMNNVKHLYLADNFIWHIGRRTKKKNAKICGRKQL